MFQNWLPLVTIIKIIKLSIKSHMRNIYSIVFFVSFPVISVYIDFCVFIPGGMKSHSCLQDRNEITTRNEFHSGDRCKRDKAFLLTQE